MKKFYYPAKEIKREYARASAGIIVSFVPLLLLKPSSVIVSILVCILCLFFLYGMRAIDRSQTQICVTAGGVCSVSIFRRTIKWEELEALKLNYFSTRRDGENGWMQLKLKGRGVSLRVESTISDFEVLVSVCAQTALKNDIKPDMATIRNMTALGINLEDTQTTELNSVEKIN